MLRACINRSDAPCQKSFALHYNGEIVQKFDVSGANGIKTLMFL